MNAFTQPLHASTFAYPLWVYTSLCTALALTVIRKYSFHSASRAPRLPYVSRQYPTPSGGPRLDCPTSIAPWRPSSPSHGRPRSSRRSACSPRPSSSPSGTRKGPATLSLRAHTSTSSSRCSRANCTRSASSARSTRGRSSASGSSRSPSAGSHSHSGSGPTLEQTLTRLRSNGRPRARRGPQSEKKWTRAGRTRTHSRSRTQSM